MPAKTSDIAPWTLMPSHARLEDLYLDRCDAHQIVSALDREIDSVRSLFVEFYEDPDVDGGYVATWCAEVRIDGVWYHASVPDHWDEGAELGDEVDEDDACPGCSTTPGRGYTQGCVHPDGCGLLSGACASFNR
jgi:hypothetical protein